MRIAMYQPDIPQNVGAMIRLCACMGVGLDIIEPCGFPWHERKIRESALDYIQLLNLERYKTWDHFQEQTAGRIVLMTTKAAVPYTNFDFQDKDILLTGQESLGVPEGIHDSVDARVLIPMQTHARSMNIVNATAMILGEALRQTRETL